MGWMASVSSVADIPQDGSCPRGASATFPADGGAAFGRNLRCLRMARGVSQEWLAADAGVARTYIGEVEQAQKAVTVDVLDKLAVVLDVSAGEFLRIPDDGEEEPARLRGGRRRR